MTTSPNVDRADAARLSARARGIGASATMAAGERAQRLRRQGVEVLDLGPGQPDFDTPEHIREAGIRAIRDGKTRYTPAAGIPELREAIAQMYGSRDGVEYDRQETVVTCGGKQGLHNALMALVEPGDEVIIPTPYWVSFPEQVRLAGGTPVYVETREEDGFKLQPEMVAQACNERTRVIVVNTPSNPSGAVISPEQMEGLARLAIDRGIMLLFDECYASLVYPGAEHVSPLILGRDAKEVTVLCGSCSKSYAMTGWRIGWVAGPRAVIEAMGRMQGHTTSNPCSVSQYAALEAITGDQEPVRRMLEVFGERRSLVLPRVRALPGVSCVEPQGAFYVFPNITSLLSDATPTSADLVSHFLDTVRVMTVPGAAFGREGFLRLSYATSTEVLEDALFRLGSACSDLLG